MKKQMFKKFTAALLILVMILSIITTLSISASTSSIEAALLVPYDRAEDGELLYQVNFNGDTAFQPNRYLGQLNNQILGDTTQFIPSADGSELTIQGNNESGARFHWWGDTIEGLEAGTDKYYTMVYKTKPLDRVDADGNAQSVGMNNAFSVGGWSADPDS